MNRTTVLRHQHIIITGCIARLAAMIDEGSERDALAINHAIDRLTKMLRIHFRQEDDFFYPELLTSQDLAVAETARAFKAEVGELWQQYEGFAGRWLSRHVIAADFPLFKSEAKVILAAIDDRCRREDEQLFPVADAEEPLRLSA
jgi:hemerythrin